LYSGTALSCFEEETAFVCNSSTHWFTIRKFQGIWYDLNSTNKYPEMMDTNRIKEFLENCLNFEYLLFAIKGEFPNHNRDLFSANGTTHQSWFKAEAIQDLHLSSQFKNIAIKPPKDDSQPHSTVSSINSMPNMKHVIPDKPESVHVSATSIPLTTNEEDKEACDEKSSVKIKFRLPDGRFVSNDFRETSSLIDVYNFVNMEIGLKYKGQFTLLSNYPYVTYYEIAESIISTNIKDGQTIFIKICADD